MIATKFAVQINFEGAIRPLEVEPHQLVRSVLEQALKLFGVANLPHTYSLFFTSGARVPEQESVEKAGITTGMVLLLAPDAVKGGAQR